MHSIIAYKYNINGQVLIQIMFVLKSCVYKFFCEFDIKNC